MLGAPMSTAGEEGVGTTLTLQLRDACLELGTHDAKRARLLGEGIGAFCFDRGAFFGALAPRDLCEQKRLQRSRIWRQF